jgi:GDSL-like lipase/acylhydrolase family protein
MTTLMSIFQCVAGRNCSLHVDDPNLLHRGNPRWPEHDGNGFRNDRIPDRSDVILIGDSQTYGVGVPSHSTWPVLLAAQTKRLTYNAGLGGWGLMQYGLITTELLPLRPRDLVVAIYTGNDIYEAFFATRASQSPLAQSWWRPQYAHLPWIDISRRRAKLSRLAQLTSQKHLPRPKALAICAQAGVPNCNLATLGDTRFFLEDEYRLRNQDLSEPAIQAGLEITSRALQHIVAVTEAVGATLTVLLIPTREYLVYRQRHALSRINDPQSLDRLGQNESQLLAHLTTLCRSLYVKCIDLTPVLEGNLSEGIYRSDADDGHFTAQGCRVVASALSTSLGATPEPRTSTYPLY